MGKAYDGLKRVEQEAVHTQACLNLRINPKKMALGQMSSWLAELERIASDTTLVTEAIDKTRSFVGNVEVLEQEVIGRRHLDELKWVHGVGNGGAKGR